MKRIPTAFLQGVVVLIAAIALAFLIWFPRVEGRAANLDLASIYLDPFILYGYLASLAFFFVLYKVFRLLGYMGQNKVFSLPAVRALRQIKLAAIVLGLAIVAGGVYIATSHHPDDDPAGFLGMCIITTFACAVVATAAAVFQRMLQNALDIKSENDLTI